MRWTSLIEWPAWLKCSYSWCSCTELLVIQDRREELCSSVFKQIVEIDQRKLAGLLPAHNDSERYNFRTRRMFSIPIVKTKRFGHTFIMHFAIVNR